MNVDLPRSGVDPKVVLMVAWRSRLCTEMRSTSSDLTTRQRQSPRVSITHDISLTMRAHLMRSLSASALERPIR